MSRKNNPKARSPAQKKLKPAQRAQLELYEEAERTPIAHAEVLKLLGEIDAISLERVTKPDGVAVMLKIDNVWVELIREHPSGNMAHTLYRSGIAHLIRMKEIERWSQFRRRRRIRHR